MQVLITAPTGYADPGPPRGFPPGHAELLGGASYAALFGQVGTEDAASQSASVPVNPHRPPNINALVRVNAAQVPPPTGRLGRSETTLAVMANGKNIVVGWNDAEGFLRRPFGTVTGTPGLSGYGFSTDGGKTFTDGGTVFFSDLDPANPSCGRLVTRGDPWLDIGGTGNDTVYYANLSVYENPSAACQQGGIPAGVSVHRGQFSGGTFVWDDQRLLKSPGYPFDFYDKEALAAEKNGSRPHVYVSLTNFIGLPGGGFCTVAGGFGQIELWRSLDAGNTWSGPTIVRADQTTPATNCLTGNLLQGSDPAVGSDGEVYVAWQEGPNFVGGASVLPLAVNIRVARSDDFGASFGSAVKVADIKSIRNSPPNGYGRTRINDFPRIAVAQAGPNRGRVYVSYQSAPSNGAHASDVFINYSDDKGATWSSPVLIGTAVSTNTQRFWPVVSVQRSGNVDVVYYQSVETNVTTSTTDFECLAVGRAAPGFRLSSLVDVFWAQSLDGGATFETPVRVTAASSNWCKARVNIVPNFGDYIHSVSHGNRVFLSWAEGTEPTAIPFAGRDRNADAYYTSIDTIGRAPR